jgi:hypothetical protein
LFLCFGATQATQFAVEGTNEVVKKALNNVVGVLKENQNPMNT